MLSNYFLFIFIRTVGFKTSNVRRKKWKRGFVNKLWRSLQHETDSVCKTLQSNFCFAVKQNLSEVYFKSLFNLQHSRLPPPPPPESWPPALQIQGSESDTLVTFMNCKKTKLFLSLIWLHILTPLLAIKGKVSKQPPQREERKLNRKR
jgi:hypothetical protein